MIRVMPFLGKGFFWSVVALFIGGIVLIEPDIVLAHLLFGQKINLAIDWVLPSALREKLGDAFIIAGILAMVVDKYLKRNLLVEVMRDALSFAAGHTLPSPIKSTITDMIRTPYARKGFKIRFTLTDLPDHPQYIKMIMHTSYDVVNLTARKQGYTVRTAIDKSYLNMRDSELLALGISGSTCISFGDSELRANRKVDSHYYYYDHKVTLEPRGGTMLHVETTRSIVYPDRWFYVLDVLQLTMGIEVQVRKDRFTWDADFGAYHERCSCSTGWACSGVYLPGQFVRVTWAIKAPQ